MIGASEVEDGKGILLAGVHLEGKKGEEGVGKGGEKALSSAASKVFWTKKKDAFVTETTDCWEERRSGVAGSRGNVGRCGYLKIQTTVQVAVSQPTNAEIGVRLVVSRVL